MSDAASSSADRRRKGPDGAPSIAEGGVDRALELIELLARHVGPRRPGGSGEALAGATIAREAEAVGASVEVQAIRTPGTFAATFGPILGLAAAPAVMPSEWRLGRLAAPSIALALGALEDGLRHPLVSRIVARRPSQNVIARAEPRLDATRTVCLVCHLDSSRSGAMFREPLLSRLRLLLAAGSVAMGVSASGGILERLPGGRRLVRLARGALGLELALLVERELRGSDVPGANDNASGVAAALCLLERAIEHPLEHTRIVMLATGGEEAGTVGMQSFLRAHGHGDWIYLNFDGVCAPATLRFLAVEGIVRRWRADEALVRIARELAVRCPGLGLEEGGARAGLTYDATPVLARGGRALTISAQDDTIPAYHAPQDRWPDNVDRSVLGRALNTGWELLEELDRGAADAP